MPRPTMPSGVVLAVQNPWAELASGGAREEPAAARPGDDDRTPVPPAERTQGTPPRSAPDDTPVGLFLVNAPEPGAIGRFIPIGAGPIAIGRSSEAGVRVEDPGVSRLHVRIVRRDDGRHVAEDLGSTNGTYLNGTAIRAATLVPGDRLQIGTGTELIFGSRRADVEEMIRLRQALGAAGAGAWEWTASSGRLALSGGLVRALGRGADATEPPEDDGWARVLPEERDRVQAALRRALERGEPLELECRLRAADGSVAWLAMKGEPFRDHAGAPVRVAGTAMDVTERKRAELESRRQALLFDSLSDALVVVGRDGAIVDWNTGAERLFGWTKAEALGRRPGALLHPERQDALTGRLVAAARGPAQAPEELVLRHRSGEAAHVDLATVPLRAEDGEPVATVAIFRDRGERRRLEARIRVSERLASLGTLAAGVAHEINNPLSFIIANLQYVAESVAAGEAGAVPPEVASALADSLAGAARIRGIVADLRQYGDPRAVRPGPVDVAEVVDFALRIAASRFRDRARVRSTVAAVPPVRGDRIQLGQVLLNLLVNAADALSPERAAENEIAVVVRHDAEADRVVVEVSDNGAGIAPADARHVFDPFFTTKPLGLGTGLGLFVCHGLVTGMGGEIAFEPGPGGRGTTFRISLRPAGGAEPAAG